MKEAQEGATEIAIGYGELIEVLIDFMVIGLTIFTVIKMMNRFQSKAEDPKNPEVQTPKNIQLLTNIEKLIEEQNKLLKNKNV